jgi:GPH family glycoside/pentoside/hexuronide:cation symporter
MTAGAVPACFACFLSFFPPDATASSLNVLWLIFFQALFFIAFGMYVMPHNALLIELGKDEKERLELSTYISVTYALGIITAALTPDLAKLFAHATGWAKVDAFRAAIGSECLFALGLMSLPLFVIDEKKYCRSAPSSEPVWAALKSTLQNRGFRRFVFSDAAYWMGLAIIETGLLYYVTVLARKEETYVSTVLITMLVSSFVAYPLVNFLAKRRSRKALIQAAFLLLSVPFGIIFFIGKIPVSEEALIFTIGVFAGAPAAFLGILPNTVVADISELDTLETGVNKEGMYFAARTTLMKLGQTLGIIVFAALLTFGKEPGADMGVRLSGLAGVALCITAMIIFSPYDERGTLEKIRALRTRSASQSPYPQP